MVSRGDRGIVGLKGRDRRNSLAPIPTPTYTYLEAACFLNT
jgi:hypothetical protein